MRGVNFPAIMLLLVIVFVMLLHNDRNRTTAHTDYYENGIVSETYRLDAEKRLHGKAYSYDTEGHLRIITRYDHGEWTEKTTFDSAGVIVERRVAF